MTLTLGDTLRLIMVDLAEITFTDGISARDAAPGYRARVLHL
ncbi:hypothetical protein AB3464_04855 [Pseudomonas asplenii]